MDCRPQQERSSQEIYVTFSLHYIKKSQNDYVYNEVISTEQWMMKIMLRVPKMNYVALHSSPCTDKNNC